MKDDLKLWPLVMGGVIFIVVLWLLTPLVVKGFYPNDYGKFGDLFGSINALFSGLAFLGVILAILLQRKELELTREVHKESVKVMEKQSP